jgi:hypothetical protein
MVDIATDPLCQEALALLTSADPDGGVDRLVALAGPDRSTLVGARDAFATRLHHHGDDHAATGALRLLNRALSAYGWHDPYDWHSRFGHRFLIKP